MKISRGGSAGGRVALVLSPDDPEAWWSWTSILPTAALRRSLLSASGVRKRRLEPGAVDTIFTFSTPATYRAFLHLSDCDPGLISVLMGDSSSPPQPSTPAEGSTHG